MLMLRETLTRAIDNEIEEIIADLECIREKCSDDAYSKEEIGECIDNLIGRL